MVGVARACSFTFWLWPFSALLRGLCLLRPTTQASHQLVFRVVHYVVQLLLVSRGKDWDLWHVGWPLALRAELPAEHLVVLSRLST